MSNVSVTHPGQQRITLEQLEQARPYKPDCRSEDFSAHEARTLVCLREAGPRGYSNKELRERGCGERPSNRVCSLRKKGHLIKTDRSSYPARFVLLREVDGSEPQDWFTAKTGRPRPSAVAPLFALTAPEPCQ